MTDKQPTTVIFRNEETKLKFPLFAIMKLEDAGVKLDEIGDSTSITNIVKIVWAGLLFKFPDATVEEVANTYELSDMELLGEALSAGISASAKSSVAPASVQKA